MNALEYRSVAKTFGDVRAVKPLSLDVPEGGIFGLLGPNGAGKTTLIRMTLGIILPDSGTVSVLGAERSKVPGATFGYLPEERGLYPKMKVWELLAFFGQVRGLKAAEAKSRALAGLKRLGLAEWSEKKVEELSKGMQQKVQLLVALIHRPKVAILDEPFSGLDPVNVELFYSVIEETRRQGTTIVLSTHQMEQVEKLCERIALVNHGEVVLQGGVDDIRKEYGARELKVTFAADVPPNGILGGLVDQARADGREVRYRMAEGARPRDIMLKLLQEGCDVSGFEEAHASMHDIFVRVVTGEKGGDHVQ